MKRNLTAAALCGMTAAAALAHITRNKWIDVPLEVVLTFVFAAPAAAVGVMAFFMSRRGRPAWLVQTCEQCLVLVVVVAAFWTGLPIRRGLAWYDQKKARDFCAFLVPAIERYHAEHSGYPEDIAWIVAEQGGGKPPKLVENGFQYHRRDGSFVLSFVAPDRPYAWNVFESKRGTWTVEVD